MEEHKEIMGIEDSLILVFTQGNRVINGRLGEASKLGK